MDKHRSGYLFAELVTGEGKNAETFLRQAGIHVLELFVVLIRRASFRRHVDDESNTASAEQIGVLIKFSFTAYTVFTILFSLFFL